tara:strand:+ start:525 stop:716 length:192 start_codon:yes stop_codon:yes gene_type:complete
MREDADCIRNRHSRASDSTRLPCTIACFAAAAPLKGFAAAAVLVDSARRDVHVTIVRMHSDAA